MPAWSPEIANHFIALADKDGVALDQLQLQKLVYLAHGWRLATGDQPLTGDRPEAWDYGPIYRRLADALAGYGQAPVTSQIVWNEENASPHVDTSASFRSNLDETERDIIDHVYQDYGCFPAARLSALTRRGSAPWSGVFAGGTGRFRDIPHALIRAQFVELAARSRHDGFC